MTLTAVLASSLLPTKLFHTPFEVTSSKTRNFARGMLKMGPLRKKVTISC
jgi:hypothetical protein